MPRLLTIELDADAVAALELLTNRGWSEARAVSWALTSSTHLMTDSRSGASDEDDAGMPGLA